MQISANAAVWAWHTFPGEVDGLGLWDIRDLYAMAFAPPLGARLFACFTRRLLGLGFGAWGGSKDGGLSELLEFLPSRPLSAAFSPASAAFSWAGLSLSPASAASSSGAWESWLSSGESQAALRMCLCQARIE
ncbi:MAG: hypothetical protein FWG10_02980 [Eubacteriaceae bacterium]|nr:hypothetical protein [Eubacteriaceae bacterium]